MAPNRAAPAKKAVAKKKVASKKDSAELTPREKNFIDQFWAQAREMEEAKERKVAEEESRTPGWLKWWRKWRAAVAWGGFGLLSALGFWRVETAIREERETRARFDMAEDREQEEDRIEARQACMQRNFSTRNGRYRDELLLDAVARALPRSEVVQIVRDEVLPLDAAQREDRDCNGDGQITEADYSE